MTNWKDIHQEFTPELQKHWEDKKFTREEVQKWIEKNFNPADYELANFVKHELGYTIERIQVNSEVDTFRSIYQKRLEQQYAEDLQIQEAINQSLLNLDLSPEELQTQQLLLNFQANTPLNEEDMGWLTDDNIEYILKKDEIVNQAKNVQVKTDIANIFFQIDKSKKNEKVDEDFWASLNTSKKYVILPLRVNGNHWSLLLFVNNEQTKKVNWIYYISSLNFVEQEIKEIENFLRQVGKRFGASNNAIINEKNILEVEFKQNPRQPNTWDCGVYICEFIKFLCVDEYYNLNEQNFLITSAQIKEFRNRWKWEIGEEKWCKWDTNPNLPVKKTVDYSQREEKSNLQEEVNKLKEILQNVSNERITPKELTAILENQAVLQKETENLRKKVSLLENQLFLENVDNQSLEREKKALEKKLARADISADNSWKEKQNLRETQQKNEELTEEKVKLEETLRTMTMTNKNLHKELVQEKKKNEFLNEQLQTIQQQEQQRKIIAKQNHLEVLIKQVKSKIATNFHHTLNRMLKSYIEYAKSNNSFAWELFEESKQEILNSRQISESEINFLCQAQGELISLENQQKEILEAKIVVSNKNC